MTMRKSKKKKEGALLGIIGFVLSIVALILSWIPGLGLILAIGAIILCGIALTKSEANRGLIVAGLVFGIIATLVALTITLITFLVAGVGSTLKSDEEIATLGEIYVTAETWDADPEIDGLEFEITPKNDEGDFVAGEGNLKVNLWELECINESKFGCIKRQCTRKDNNLVKTWDFQIKEEDYDWLGDARIRMEYELNTLKSEEGCLEATLTTQNGKSFTARDDYVDFE